MGRLSGKTAFLTAAGQGIGEATARAFAAEGAKVFATDLSAELLAKLKGDLPGIETATLDARDTDAVKAMAAKVGAVDILFNCAGFVHHGNILECDEEAWDFSFDLNVKSLWRTLNAFMPAMLANGGGSIINMASVASSITAAPNRAVYGATKAAVIGLTRSVALDYCRQGIRCNSICPGTIVSPSLEGRISALPGAYEDNYAAFMDRQPMGRMGTTDEIAAMAVYLASDESGFVTGSEFRIDGAWAV